MPNLRFTLFIRIFLLLYKELPPCTGSERSFWVMVGQSVNGKIKIENKNRTKQGTNFFLD